MWHLRWGWPLPVPQFPYLSLKEWDHLWGCHLVPVFSSSISVTPVTLTESPFNSDTVGKAAKSTTEWAWRHSNKTFYPDTKMGISSNFHLAWNIILLIFKPFSNVKTAFSSRASKKQVSDWQWPLTEEPQMSHPDLCESQKLPNELVFNALPDVKILFCWNKVGGFSHLSVNTCYL